jgi:hypothetical protein
MNWNTFYYMIIVPIIVIKAIIYVIKKSGNPNKNNIVVKKYDFSKKTEEDKFVTESAFNNNLQKQMRISTQAIYQFRNINPAEEKELKLEYFFYTNKAENTEPLIKEIEKLNYTVKQSLYQGDNKTFVVTGWTTKIKITDEVVKKWANQMCELGYQFDCEFDVLVGTPGQKKMIPEFDRNDFKNFVEKNKLIEKQECSQNHSEIVINSFYPKLERKSSFISITDEKLNKSYLLIGSLRDVKIKTLDYIEYNNNYGEYWSAKSKIATNFYPYHNCEVYKCKYCNKLFLVYTEYGGHGPQQRIRNVNAELIVEEPSNCTLKIPKEKITNLLSFLEIEENEFNAILEENKTLDRIHTDFDIEKIIIKKKHEDYYLIIAKQDIIYDLITIFD